MQGLPWLLARLLYVVTGVVWTGGAVLIAAHLMPAVRATAAGQADVSGNQSNCVRRVSFLDRVGRIELQLDEHWARAEGATADENQTLGRLAAINGQSGCR